MGERVEVVYIINALEVGGAEVGMCRLFQGLDESRYNITVIALDGKRRGVEDKIPEWVEILKLRNSTGSHFSSYWKIFNAIRGADVIVGSLFYSSVAAKIGKAISPSAKLFTWRHNTEFKTKKRKFIFNLTSSLPHAVLADSEAVAEALLEGTNIQNSSVYTVPIAGIKLEDYCSVTHKPTDRPVVGTVGRLTEQKNHSTILDVAKKLENTNIRFEIAGEGNLRDKLEENIRRRKINNVTLRGFVKDVPKFLSELDIYFQPSHHEGMCITVLEAMASGLPIVGSRTGGIQQNVTHGENGYIFNATDVNDFATAIQELGDNADLRAIFGKKSRKIVSENFTQEVLASEFEKAISRY